jgi:hypothetical protein
MRKLYSRRYVYRGGVSFFNIDAEHIEYIRNRDGVIIDKSHWKYIRAINTLKIYSNVLDVNIFWRSDLELRKSKIRKIVNRILDDR